jgi:peptide deformylase
LKYKDLENMDRILVARDRHAALVEHEIDHLNGIFNTDY